MSEVIGNIPATMTGALGVIEFPTAAYAAPLTDQLEHREEGDQPCDQSKTDSAKPR